MSAIPLTSHNTVKKIPIQIHSNNIGQGSQDFSDQNNLQKYLNSGILSNASSFQKNFGIKTGKLQHKSNSRGIKLSTQEDIKFIDSSENPSVTKFSNQQINEKI